MFDCLISAVPKHEDIIIASENLRRTQIWIICGNFSTKCFVQQQIFRFRGATLTNSKNGSFSLNLLYIFAVIYTWKHLPWVKKKDSLYGRKYFKTQVQDIDEDCTARLEQKRLSSLLYCTYIMISVHTEWFQAQLHYLPLCAICMFGFY